MDIGQRKRCCRSKRCMVLVLGQDRLQSRTGHHTGIFHYCFMALGGVDDTFAVQKWPHDLGFSAGDGETAHMMRSEKMIMK